MKNKIKSILDMLDFFFPNPSIPLEHKDPYTLLVAVVLSARNRDERVNKVTPQLFKLANNPRDMIKLKQETIQQIIRPCGLSPQKSKAIVGLSKILIDKYKGEVPKNFEDLEYLPGVGHKTASVVMTQAFDIPAFPVDTHIHRLMYRWGLSEGKNVVQTEKDAKKLFPKEKWGKIHLQMIYYGRQYCPARGFRLEKCPITQRYGGKLFLKTLNLK